jgi:hypothetical protein
MRPITAMTSNSVSGDESTKEVEVHQVSYLDTASRSGELANAGSR